MADPWWQLVGLAAAPRLAEAVVQPQVKLFQLLQIALLEHGEAMHEAAIAQRLAALGVVSPRTDLVTALVKSWHGLPPVRRQRDGLLAIDIEYRWLTLLPQRLGLVPETRIGARSVAEEPPLAPPPTVPLSREECAALLACNGLASLSDARAIAAILEAHGSPMTLAAINAILGSATGGWGRRRQIAPERLRGWREALVVVNPGASLSLSDDQALLMGMRTAVRLRAYVLLREQERHRRSAVRRTSRPPAATVQAEAAAPLRRLVVRAYPAEGLPRALSVLDPVAHAITTVVDASIPAMAALLAGADLIVGLEPERSLAALGLERRCADLTRHPHTRQLNRRGRTLRITTARTDNRDGRHQPPLVRPGGHAPVPRRRRHHPGLRRRLESDVKALAAFYRYGRLHGDVRLRWGFLDERRPVEWPGSPGDPLHAMVAAASAADAELDVVAGSAPGWADPWSRAMRGRATLDHNALRLHTRQGLQVIPRAEIQAVRVCTAGQTCDQAAGGGRPGPSAAATATSPDAPASTTTNSALGP